MSHVYVSPSTVSRKLRQAGMRPLPSGTPRDREGVRVSGSSRRTGLPSLDAVSVVVSIDGPAHRARIAVDVVEVLTGAGYIVEETARQDGLDGHVIYRVSQVEQ